MQWTLWRAAGRFDSVAPEPGAVEVARIWAAEGADRILAAAQHIHGGLGVDVSYPLAAYFLRTRRLLLTGGGAQRHLAVLGAALASGACR